MLAIQDALATFPADEIVVALRPEDEAEFAERVGAARRAGLRRTACPYASSSPRTTSPSYPLPDARARHRRRRLHRLALRQAPRRRRRRGGRARQAHLRRQSGQPRRASTSHLAVGDIADADAVARAGRGARRSSTSPPRRTSTARSSTPRDFVHTDVVGTQVLLEWARDDGRALRPGVHRRGLRRSRARRPLRARTIRCGRRARTARRRRAATCRCSPTCAPTA